MNHIDLFSGIGGFAYAAKQVWGNDYHNVFFCDNNLFCQQVIKKNFGKDSVIYGDIREVTRERVIADACTRNSRQGGKPASGGGERVDKGEETPCSGIACGQGNGGILQEARHKDIGRNEIIAVAATKRSQDQTNKQKLEKERGDELQFGKSGNIQSVTDAERLRKSQSQGCIKEERGWISHGIDLLTGGFPCQPFSCAGKRKGMHDDRYLWPEMFKCIREFAPRWVVAENVRGLLTIKGGLVFEQVCTELEGEGYEVQPFIIPACSVNAPHRRDRVWIIAHCERAEYDRGLLSQKRARSGFTVNSSDATNPGDQQGRAEPEVKPGGQARLEAGEHRCACQGDDTNTECPRWAYRVSGQEQEKRAGECRNKVTQPDWGKNWLEVATELCRVDDGSPAELDGFKLTAASHRVERLKALGNAIVPAVAIEIFKGIRNTELQVTG